MKDNSSPNGPEDIRTRAEESLKSDPYGPGDTGTERQTPLFMNCGCIRLELEMQNEELRRVQNDLEISRSRYADLYDFSPVGYLTLDKRGQIVDLNLTAAKLIGIERDV